ncbi:unnamed protein product, partial [Symbiodinium necroappetens]
MGRLALCIGGHDAGPEAFTRSCSGRTALTLHQLRAKSVSFVDTVHAGEPYHQSQNGYWDEYGQWVAEAEKEAQADAEAENLNTQRELALADPASVVEIASQKAGKAITRAENNSADAQVLHMRLHAQKATNLVRYFRDELRELMRRRSTAGLKRQLDSLDQYLDTLKTCEHHNSGRCNKLSKRALSGLGHDASAAAHAVEQLIQTSRNAKRRTFPILDLLRTGIGPAPDQLDALDAPTPPDYVPPPGPVPGTAAGCNCAPHSHCAGRGREFPWCKVNRTEPCSLLSERSFVDASGADHRVAGSGQPPAVWDYCGITMIQTSGTRTGSSTGTRMIWTRRGQKERSGRAHAPGTFASLQHLKRKSRSCKSWLRRIRLKAKRAGWRCRTKRPSVSPSKRILQPRLRKWLCSSKTTVSSLLMTTDSVDRLFNKGLAYLFFQQRFWECSPGSADQITRAI